jgi:opacity protein-like surface antigen
MMPATARVDPMLKLHAPLVLAAGLAMVLPAAAADYIPEPPVIEYVEPAPVYGGWYLRGHIGMSNQRLGSLDNPNYSRAAFHQFLNEGDFASAPVVGGGIGYKVNDYLRLDGIVEYRGKSSFRALDRYDSDGDGVWDGTNEYNAKKSELLLMANAYADLGDFYGITPYIGAGIGVSRNTIHGFTDTNTPTGGVAYGGTRSEWELAWALHAGVGIKASDRVTIDLGYSYVDLGDGMTNDVIAYDGSDNVGPYTFKNITSHDFKLGVRYSLY